MNNQNQTTGQFILSNYQGKGFLVKSGDGNYEVSTGADFENEQDFKDALKKFDTLDEANSFIEENGYYALEVVSLEVHFPEPPKSERKNNTIVAFHIGRGGRFWNQGHLSYHGERDINAFTGDLFLKYENESKIFEKIEGKPNLEAKYYQATEDGPLSNEAISFFKNRLRLDFGELVYTDGSGNEVGLSFEEAKTGIGRIEIDGDYNTTYTSYLEDLDQNEFSLLPIHLKAEYVNIFTEIYVEENTIEKAFDWFGQDCFDWTNDQWKQYQDELKQEEEAA